MREKQTEQDRKQVTSINNKKNNMSTNYPVIKE